MLLAPEYKKETLQKALAQAEKGWIWIWNWNCFQNVPAAKENSMEELYARSHSFHSIQINRLKKRRDYRIILSWVDRAVFYGRSLEAHQSSLTSFQFLSLLCNKTIKFFWLLRILYLSCQAVKLINISKYTLFISVPL